MDNELGSLSTGLLNDFDIVTYDPRGVQRSDPSPARRRRVALIAPPCHRRPTRCPKTPASEQTSSARSGPMRRLVRRRVAPCSASSAPSSRPRILIASERPSATRPSPSWASPTAHSSPPMRDVPDHVRAMVLDSAIDPTLSSNQDGRRTAVGFEQSLRRLLHLVRRVVVPVAAVRDPTPAVLTLINDSLEQPIPAGAGHSIGPGEIYDALLAGLYARSDWPTLADALGEAASGNGAGIVSMSDHYDSNGSSNGADAGAAISSSTTRCRALCPPTRNSAAADGALAGLRTPSSPGDRRAARSGQLPATRTPGPIRATGAPPILVVGTTGDPATPYAWAVSLAKQLQRGVLLTGTGWTMSPTSTARVSGASCRATSSPAPCRRRGPPALADRSALDPPGSIGGPVTLTSGPVPRPGRPDTTRERATGRRGLDGSSRRQLVEEGDSQWREGDDDVEVPVGPAQRGSPGVQGTHVGLEGRPAARVRNWVNPRTWLGIGDDACPAAPTWLSRSARAPLAAATFFAGVPASGDGRVICGFETGDASAKSGLAVGGDREVDLRSHHHVHR